MSKTIAIIPARSGSKGVPDKNIKLLAAKPLMAYSIMAARLARNIDRVIVSTDSEKYADIAREYGAEVPFLRPNSISTDTSSDYQFIRHALDWLVENEGTQPEYLVHLRPTTPLREVCYIDLAVETIRKNRNATALRSVHEMAESAYKTFEMEGNYLKRVGVDSLDLDAANNPRQTFKKTYEANGYVDVIISEYVMKHGKIHGNRVFGYITPPVAEVDTEDDFNYLEYRITVNNEIVNKLFG
jgi:CMP-N,N'-diacetyllegionaminic acid synthase